MLEAFGFGGWLKPPYIFGAYLLGQWAITHSLKDCCFWANLLDVFAGTPPLPLSHHFETLARSLGCFPFHREAYPPRCNSTGFPKVFEVWQGLVTPLDAPSPTRALPPWVLTSRPTLKWFRGEPAITEFDELFTPNHRSSEGLAAPIRSDLPLCLHRVHPAHG